MRAYVSNRNRRRQRGHRLDADQFFVAAKLSRFGISRQHLFDACVNAYVGTWILASNISQFGATWKAVGAYNAVSSSKQLVYANKIYRRLQRAN